MTFFCCCFISDEIPVRVRIKRDFIWYKIKLRLLKGHSVIFRRENIFALSIGEYELKIQQFAQYSLNSLDLKEENPLTRPLFFG